MPLAAIEWPGLNGGLDLRARNLVPPGRALRAFNTSPMPDGGVRSRPGWRKFASPASYFVDMLPIRWGSTDQLLCAGPSIAAYDLNTRALVTASIYSNGQDVCPGSSDGRFFVSRTSGAPVYWDANAGLWGSTPFTGVTPIGRHLSRTPWDGRMVSADDTTVRFSEVDDPVTGTYGSTTFPADNYINVTTKADPITALVVWREFLFVFCRRKFFVFYTTTNNPATGVPEFPYRTVNTGDGCEYIQNQRGPVCVAPDGVYFAGPRGVFKTTGGIPQRMFPELDPVFVTGEAAATLIDPSLTNLNIDGYLNMGYVAGRLLITLSLRVPGGGPTSTALVLCWDQLQDAWAVWSIRSGSGGSAIIPRCVVGVPDAITPTGAWTMRTKQIERLFMSSSAGGISVFDVEGMDGYDWSGDPFFGQSIESIYQTGWSDLGSPLRKTVREVKLWLSGAAGSTNVQLFCTPTPSQFATSPPVRQASRIARQPRLVRGLAARGQFFSLGFDWQPAQGVGRVERAELHVRQPPRAPSISTTDSSP